MCIYVKIEFENISQNQSVKIVNRLSDWSESNGTTSEDH